MQPQTSPQGIASLYMGNPGALQQRVKKEQQGNPGLPPDLSKLMALNIVTNENDAAKRQQAMSALQQMSQGAQQPPTVAQSIQEQAKQKMQAQLVQQQRQQAAMQQLAQQGGLAGAVPDHTPQPTQQPQGIDELPVEMSLAEGGIIGYAEGDEVGYETPYDRMNRKNREEAAARERARLADEAALQAGPDVVSTDGEYYAKPLAADAREASPRLQQFIEYAGRNVERDPDTGEVVRKTETEVARGRPTMGADPRLLTTPAGQGLAAALRAASAQTAPRMDTGRPNPVAQAAGLSRAAAAGTIASPAQQGLGALLEQTIRSDLGRDREAEAQRMSEQYAKLAGHDQYAKQLQDIIGGRQAAIEKAQAGRTPEWVKGLQALSGAPVRGGLGMMLGQAGAAATRAREAYGDEDMKYTQEMDKLREAAARAQLEGNTSKAKTYMDAYKEVDAARRSALTSGTSLENTRENAAARKQMAAEAAAGRSEARADKSDEAMRQKAMSLAMGAATKAMALPQNMMKYKGMSTEQVAASMFNEIYNALKTGKMGAAPGAASPGGTMSGWGKAQVVK